MFLGGFFSIFLMINVLFVWIFCKNYQVIGAFWEKTENLALITLWN